MAKYKQTYIYDNEDSFGSNTIEFIITDTFTELFDETSAIAVDLFILEKLKIDFQNENGGLVQDDLSILTADHHVKNSDEQDCLDLVNSAVSTKVYCAILFNPNVTLEKDDIIFVGAFDEDIRTEAISWNRAEFSTSATIINAYNYGVVPIVEISFDDIKMKDVIDEIDSSWISANVSDRDSWRTYTGNAVYFNYEAQSVSCDLVSLNKAIRKIADEAIAMFNTNLGVSYTINFNRVKLPGKYAPARWRVPEINTPFITNRTDAKVTGSLTDEWEDLELYHNLDDGTDYREYYIDPDAVTEDEDETIFVDFKYFKDLDNEYEYSTSAAKSYRIGANDETFTDFIYKLAANFNFVLLISFDAIDEEINITIADASFVDTSEVLYFKDAKKYKRDISTKSSNNKTPFYTESFYSSGRTRFGNTNEKNGGFIYGLSKDGLVSVTDNLELKTAFDNAKKKDEDDTSGEKLLFTISPTVARTKKTDKNGVTLFKNVAVNNQNGATYPHNTILNFEITSGLGVGQTGIGSWIVNTRSIHTGMYVKIPSKETFEPSVYFTPIRRMAVKIDGVETGFDTLDAFLNASRLRFYKFTKQDVEISIPYWNAFSTDSAGTNPSLKNLKLGKKITLNSVEYLIHSIEIDFSKPEINLKLKQETLFSEIKNPSVPKPGNTLQSSAEYNDIENEDELYLEGICHAFSAVALNNNGNLATITDHTYLDTYFGLALDGVADDVVKVLKSPGIYEVTSSPFNAGDFLYLKVDGSNDNVFVTRLTKKESNLNCIYKRIGKMITDTTIQLFDEDYFIYD